MSEIKHRRFFILVDLKDVVLVPNVVFYNELGKRMEPQDLEETKNAFVLLAMAQKNDKQQNSHICINEVDLDLANKSRINQIKSDGSFHFETTGKIFGLGFGPKYFVDDQTNLSVGQFVEKKKLSSRESELRDEVKKKSSNFFMNRFKMCFTILMFSRKIYLQILQSYKIILNYSRRQRKMK